MFDLDGACTTAALFAALMLGFWSWRAAADDSDLEAQPDLQLLLAIDKQHDDTGLFLPPPGWPDGLAGPFKATAWF